MMIINYLTKQQHYTTLTVFCFVVMMIITPVHNAVAQQPRSQAAIYQFKKHHVCPATGKHFGKCPGFVIDHIIPLACAGNDHPDNMQWQTTADAKLKDHWERIGCESVINIKAP